MQVDRHLPDVLAFPQGTDLHDHPLVKDGRLILQVSPCWTEQLQMAKLAL